MCKAQNDMVEGIKLGRKTWIDLTKLWWIVNSSFVIFLDDNSITSQRGQSPNGEGSKLIYAATLQTKPSILQTKIKFVSPSLP
jgi:hypothetical protein